MVFCPWIWQVMVEDDRHEGDAGYLAADIPMVKPPASPPQASKAQPGQPSPVITIMPNRTHRKRSGLGTGVGIGIIADKAEGHCMALFNEGLIIIMGK